MSKFLMMSALCVCLLGVPAHATTAVLCGDPVLVDEDNDSAAVWLILMNTDSQAPEEIDVTYLGKEAKTVAVQSRQGLLTINTANPKRTVRLKEADIDSSVCDGETQFSVELESTAAMEIFGNCRCFED